MNRNRQQNLQDLLVFALLVAIGVAGRWGQPEWCVTPTAAAAIFAGLYFSRVAIALMVPVTILAISDLLLPAYNSIPVMIATYAVMIAPVWFGRLQRGEHSRLSTVASWIWSASYRRPCSSSCPTSLSGHSKATTKSHL